MGCTLALPGEYDQSIYTAAAMRPVSIITVATLCAISLFYQSAFLFVVPYGKSSWLRSDS